MANEYIWGLNPFQDALIDIIFKGGDIGSKKNIDTIYDVFKYILQFHIKDRNDMLYLDFDIEGDGDYYKVVGNNMIAALWLSGIIPENPISVLKTNEYYFDDKKFIFNSKTKVLKYEHLK